MEIILMQKGHELWDRTISFAQGCSWKAGPSLAERMKENAFQDWERVIIALEDDDIAGYCTFSEKDELPEEYGYFPFIGFVFVDERYRGRRISEKMIRQALNYAETLGFQAVYVMSGEQGLYEKYGFEKIGDFKTVYGTTDQLFRIMLKDAADVRRSRITVKPYTERELPDVLDFEKRLREEEDFWGWEIDEQYVRSVKASFREPGFDNAVSFLAYTDGVVAGRIDAVLLPSHFDGSVKAYLDWICVVKRYRHRGIAQALLAELKKYLKERGITTLIALTASNDEAQRFYRSIPDSEMRDTGIWIDIK